MKRRICWLLCLLLIGGILKAQERPIKVACVGNSITEGFTLAHPETESYPAVLQRLLGDGYEVGNFGVTAHALMLDSDLPYQKTTGYCDRQIGYERFQTLELATPCIFQERFEPSGGCFRTIAFPSYGVSVSSDTVRPERMGNP